MNNKEKEAQLLNALQAFDVVVASMQNRTLANELNRRTTELRAFVLAPGAAYEVQRDTATPPPPAPPVQEVPGGRYIPILGLSGIELKEAEAFNWLYSRYDEFTAMTYLSHAMPVQTLSNRWRAKWNSPKDTWDLQQYAIGGDKYSQASVSEDGSKFWLDRFQPNNVINLW